jgi:hypothetical protein
LGSIPEGIEENIHLGIVDSESSTPLEIRRKTALLLVLRLRLEA